MLHIHCEVPKGWICIISLNGGKTEEFVDASRVFTNGRGQVVVVHGHQDVGTKMRRLPREDVGKVTVRAAWTGE